MEAFIGVLYSGFCGAVLFGKVLRIQSHAQVIFSDPLVIRYGSGVEQPAEEAAAEEVPTTPTKDNDSTPTKTPARRGGLMDGNRFAKNKFHIPCPVLEFRIVNRLYNDVGGEIMDATLHAVANVDAGDDPSSLRDTTDSTRSGRGLFDSTDSERNYDTSSETGTSSVGSGHINKFIDAMGVFSGRSHHHHNQQTIDEDPSSRLVGKRIFSKMHIEASEHPFFKRVWLACHVLDDNSPLLTHKTRRAIRRNGGYWPAHLNSHEAVRNSLFFNQILVSLNGVSNVSAADVYAQRIYDLADGECDYSVLVFRMALKSVTPYLTRSMSPICPFALFVVNIGYQFVNLLYRDPNDGGLKVDTSLINDVREQNGGGGEPLMGGSER